MRNELLLCGEVMSAAEFSHENHGRIYDTFRLRVNRLSGTADEVDVIIPQSLRTLAAVGSTVTVTGSLRSYNNKNAPYNRLKLNVWANTLIHTPCAEHCNQITLTGQICKPPVYRRTPYGREITDVMLAVERAPYAMEHRRSDYVPCITWGSVARMCADCAVRQVLTVSGRVQSRNYVKLVDGVPCERIAYEVSVSRAEPGDELRQPDISGLADAAVACVAVTEPG